jgi:hypothetical protein
MERLIHVAALDGHVVKPAAGDQFIFSTDGHFDYSFGRGFTHPAALPRRDRPELICS